MCSCVCMKCKMLLRHNRVAVSAMSSLLKGLKWKYLIPFIKNPAKKRNIIEWKRFHFISKFNHRLHYPKTTTITTTRRRRQSTSMRFRYVLCHKCSICLRVLIISRIYHTLAATAANKVLAHIHTHTYVYFCILVNIKGMFLCITTPGTSTSISREGERERENVITFIPPVVLIIQFDIL